MKYGPKRWPRVSFAFAIAWIHYSNNDAIPPNAGVNHFPINVSIFWHRKR
jgi:hypothetical protein